MDFVDNALVIMNRRCQDPECGLLHPEIIEPIMVGVVVESTTSEAMVAVIKENPTPGASPFFAMVIEPFSIGYVGDESERLCFTINEETARDPLVLEGNSVEELKAMLDRDEGYIHAVLFGRHALPDDPGGEVELAPAGEPTNAPAGEPEADNILAALDPKKMHQA